MFSARGLRPNDRKRTVSECCSRAARAISSPSRRSAALLLYKPVRGSNNVCISNSPARVSSSFSLRRIRVNKNCWYIAYTLNSTTIPNKAPDERWRCSLNGISLSDEETRIAREITANVNKILIKIERSFSRRSSRSSELNRTRSRSLSKTVFSVVKSLNSLPAWARSVPGAVLQIVQNTIVLKDTEIWWSDSCCSY
jgi:hypothetical protein